ncbi:MAG: undecaprenyl-diphosphate phosphatase [Candidatus Pacebacteria bacterium]|nr:undecaprenyl-diphosphate phosphatase [Candidatus Paceibacterota bacterium]
MDFLSTLLISITEGITEFLPISSTGHMIIVSNFLGLKQTEILKSFETSIQLGAILSIIFLYKEKINFSKISLWWKIFLSSLPILTLGYFFADFIKSLFSIKIVAVMFIIGGILFLFLEKIYQKNKKLEINNLEKISIKQSIIIGFFQILSLIPGTSRAGATIFGSMFLGINRKLSAEFSFLLALPVMTAVFLYESIGIFKNFENFNFQTIYLFIFGFIISFITAYFTVKLFLKFLEKFTFFGFGIYRILFGTILLLFFV